jgi:hypothetical protein
MYVGVSLAENQLSPTWSKNYWADRDKVWFFLNQISCFGTCFAEIKSFVV